MYLRLHYFLAAKTIGQFAKDPTRAREEAWHSEAAGHRVLCRKTEEFDHLKADKSKIAKERDHQALQIEQLKVQLAASKEEAR